MPSTVYSIVTFLGLMILVGPRAVYIYLAIGAIIGIVLDHLARIELDDWTFTKTVISVFLWPTLVYIWIEQSQE